MVKQAKFYVPQPIIWFYYSYIQVDLMHPAKTSKNTCDFWDIRKFRLGFSMVVYEKIDLAAKINNQNIYLKNNTIQ